ncbi:DUF881 domain-containing protein [Auraticoccus monumenti]|uniref:DUF881 domain-containing protein n=1 Tax=Auraticoccus monumenti TaxID=675864 RepID=UPI001E61E25B|nr:DUF881 domain-containing protein [Auraticoccus monumenti]
MRRDRPTPRRRLLTVAVCFVAGLMITVSAINARGTDLRPGRNTDLVDLVRSEAARSSELAGRVSDLRAEVDQMATGAGSTGEDVERSARLGQQVGLDPVGGPGVTVTLTDAPASIDPVGVDGDLLVVHQQDIQAVVNVLWQGGAEAMTIQGQRVISTTGIKCVGNTVVLHGIPYAPPYVISAVGEPGALEAALAGSEYVGVYRQYVDAYGLGYEQRAETRLELPGFTGVTTLRWARTGAVG